MVIIGGGVIGVTTALFLAQRNIAVTLLEKGRIAAEQSSRNWGWIRKQGRDADELPIVIEACRLWKELAAECGEDIGLFNQFRAIFANAKTSHYAAFALLEASQFCSRADISVTDPLARRPNQHKLQRSTMDRNLRPAITRCQSPRLTMDQLPDLVAEVQALRSDPGLCKRIAESKLR